MAFRSSILASVILFAASPAFSAAQCSDENAIWTAEEDGVRSVVYEMPNETDRFGFDVAFEEWKGDKLTWFAKGFIGCSNGAVLCSLDIKNAGFSGEEGISEAIVERIDADGDNTTDFYVFAGLMQIVYHAQGLKASWVNGNPEEGMAVPENVYRISGCKQDKPVGFDRMGVYGDAAFCETYRTTGEASNVNPEGWEVVDGVMSGHDTICHIKGVNNDGTASLMCGPEGGKLEPDKASFKVTAAGLSIDGEEPLQRCN